MTSPHPHVSDLRRLRTEAGHVVASVAHLSDARSRPISRQVRIRMGFGVDVVGYSRRPAPAQNQVQDRLAQLIEETLADLGVATDDIDFQPNGDGFNVFLPPDVEIHLALPALINSITKRLGADNACVADRIRLRMAVVVGPVNVSALGFGGRTIIACGRLLDSTALRDAVPRHPHADIVVLISDPLYRYVIAEGYPGLDESQFERRRIRVKEFDEYAWLWLPPANDYQLAS